VALIWTGITAREIAKLGACFLYIDNR